jgi:hypothetical protein
MSSETEEMSVPLPLNRSLMYDVLLLARADEGEGYEERLGAGEGEPGGDFRDSAIY